MKHYALSPRAAVAAAGMAVLLVGGTTTGALADVASVSAPSALQGTPTAPGVPTGVTAIPGHGTATLSWSAPSSDGGSPVDDYVIEGGTSTSSESIQDNVGGHTATLSGLTDGTAYYFRVHAQNAYGDGASVTVEVTPQSLGSVSSRGSLPGAPNGLKTSYGDGFIALSWSPPTSTGGSLITGYHVYLGYSSSFVGAREFTTSGTSFRLTDAINGSRYYIKVTALNAEGEGSATPVMSVIPAPRVVPTPPGPSRPTGLTAQARHGQVVLSWSPPQGGLKAGDGYLIYIGISSGHEGSKPAIPYLIQFVTSYTILPLKDGTRYYFQVALLSAADNRVSPRSAEISVVPGISAGAVSSTTVGAGASSGASTRAGVPVTAQSSPVPLPGTELAQDSAFFGLPISLVILLAALVLATAAGGVTAVVLLRRRRYNRRYGPVPPPRRPHDDQPTDQPSYQPTELFSRPQKLNGPGPAPAEAGLRDAGRGSHGRVLVGNTAFQPSAVSLGCQQPGGLLPGAQSGGPPPTRSARCTPRLAGLARISGHGTGEGTYAYRISAGTAHSRKIAGRRRCCGCPVERIARGAFLVRGAGPPGRSRRRGS